MPDDEFTLWRTSTGLVDDVDIEIKDAYFEWDGENDRLLLLLELTTDDDETPETTERLGCGKGWEAYEKGAKARREDKKDKPFNNQTGVGLFINAMVDAGALEELNKRGDPREASCWKGLKFHAERKTIKSGDGFKDRVPLLPTKYLGVVGSNNGSGSGGGSVSAPPADAGDGSGEENAPAAAGLPGKLKVALIKLAKEAASHDDFLVAAYELDGVDGNPAAEAAIESPDSGIWADVHAG